jgi:hypothetical protein
MGWQTTVDLDRFAVTACGYLASKAAENTLLLSAMQAARSAQGTRATAQEPGGGWLFGWWEPPGGGEPRGAFLHDPAAPLLVSSLVPEMAASLAATLAKMSRPVLGVDAPTEAADAFAAAWSQRAGLVARVHRHCHVYRIAGPDVAPGGVPGPPPSPGRALPGAAAWPPPQPPVPPGRLRIATGSDQQLLADWLAAFANETAERMDSPLDLAADLISYGGAAFWETPQRPGRPRDGAYFLPGSRHRDAHHGNTGHGNTGHGNTGQAREPSGQPAALATLTRPTAGVVRISMLYTPPDHRHRGYASAVTMAVSRAVLSGPASPGPASPDSAPAGPALPGGRVDEIVMITDRNRPDSWAIRLGYQLVNERAVFRFGPVTGPMPRMARTGPMPRLPTGPLPRLPRLRG